MSTTLNDDASSDASKLNGYQLLVDPLLNKGTAFTDAERDAYTADATATILISTILGIVTEAAIIAFLH